MPLLLLQCMTGGGSRWGCGLASCHPRCTGSTGPGSLSTTSSAEPSSDSLTPSSGPWGSTPPNTGVCHTVCVWGGVYPCVCVCGCILVCVCVCVCMVRVIKEECPNGMYRLVKVARVVCVLYDSVFYCVCWCVYRTSNTPNQYLALP